MKILFIVADITYTGGIERVICSLSRALTKKNIDVDILSIYKSHENTAFDFSENTKIIYLSKDNYSGKPLSLTRFKDLIKKILYLRAFLKKNRKYKYIIANSFPISFMLLFCYTTANKIAYEHTHYHYYPKLIRGLRTLVYSFFKKIIVLTEKDKKFFSKRNNNVIKICNPLSNIIDRKAKLQNNIGIAAGRLEYEKGFDLLLDSISILNVKYPDNNWIFNIYGDGTEKDNLIRKAKELELKNVFFKGKTNCLHEELLNSSMLLSTSRCEGFGMTIVEAMSLGLPCVSFDSPNGPSEIITNKKDGFIIDNGDVFMFSEVIYKLIENRDELFRLGKSAISVREKYSINKIINDWLDVIR
ncbi:glycosyltransferase family 4 protein [Photobacterium phosphoreum]|uniref:glycosyltransferase family 4 protein n=1 Tax=Photobacterium phosphoreum TaxID=659 RepID=UPI0039AF15C6